MRLSFIVPVYNTQQWLSDCLDSLISQNAEAGSYEIVAVNDGSTDSSGIILEKYQMLYPDILRVSTTENGGLGHARNIGIEKAKGDYLVFVDSDDRLAAGATDEILNTIEKTEEPFDIAVFDIVYVDAAGHRLRYLSGCDTEKSFQEKDNKTAFALRDKPTFLFSPHNAVNKIWYSGLFKDTGIRFPDRLWFEDLATVPRLYLHAKRIRTVPKGWYHYLQRQGSIMLSGKDVSRNLEMTQVAEGVLDYYRELGQYGYYASELGYKFFYEEYLAAVIRVCIGDVSSNVSAQLRDDYLNHFSEYRKNPYYRSAPIRYKLLDRAIRNSRWRSVRTVMSLSHKIKQRKGSSQ